ncbi:MAG: UDP-N-acetylmuramoyl-L-alanine--D-glutamate ligase [Oscillospiraceae bacterium]|nr:UDP-N-acetylmuramoyl-L-alanine--D-glutamate ligase [Oscillospiraceae bacterium]
MTMNEYINSLKGKSIGVIGIGVSNTPLIRTLLDHGLTDITACDVHSAEDLGETARELKDRGVKLQLGPDYLEKLDFDIIFRTPGLMPFDPHLVRAKEQGSVLTSEMEAFLKICPCPVIAVTGSDGKTTTTTIISELLKKQGFCVHLGGNIGHPLFSEAETIHPKDYAVLELSSFQLHSMDAHPNVAVITNISPNHLDKHLDYKDYYDSKANIFIKQTAEDHLILNANDEMTPYYENMSSGSISYFAREQAVSNGVYSEGDSIYSIYPGDKPHLIMSASDIILPGVHNLENYLAAICATRGLVTVETCREVAHSFSGVEHRLERVRIWNGITFINDSIGTSPTRTIAGLHAMKKKPILIAGGYDKGIPFDELGTEINQYCKKIYLTGDTAELICDSIMNAENRRTYSPPVEIVEDFKDCFLTAASAAEEGDIVLLSPACAAFDHFKNFMERGKYFKELVSKL